MNERTNDALPVIAVAMGDPSGISPELTARILSEADLRGAARYVVFGDKRLLDLGTVLPTAEERTPAGFAALIKRDADKLTPALSAAPKQ